MDVASMAEPIGEHMAVMKLYIWRYGHYHCLRFLQQAVETIHILASTRAWQEAPASWFKPTHVMDRLADTDAALEAATAVIS